MGNGRQMKDEQEQQDQQQSLYSNGNSAKEPQIVSGLNHTLETKPVGEQSRAVRRQALMVILSNVGIMSTGMALAIPTVTLPQLTSDKEPVYLTSQQSSWFASINTLSSPLGGLLSGFLLDRIGRKRTLYVLNLLAITAWTLLATASKTDSEAFYWQLLVSRFISGMAMGLATAPPGVYAAEISVPKIRGNLIMGLSISAAMGIIIIYSIGYFIRDDYRLIAMICCGYQIVGLLCVVPLPETHSWLLSKKRVPEAMRSLNYFRGLDKSAHITHPQVLEEFQVLQKSLELREGEKKTSFIRSLRLPEVYKPLIILMGLFAFQQLSGIFVVIVYAVQITSEAGVSIDPFLCAVLIGVARVVTTFPLGYVLERWGRRRAGIVSTIGMSSCMFLLAAHGWIDWMRNVPFLPAIAIVSFIVLSTLGLYTLPFFMVSELFPQKVRGPATGLTVAVGMCIAFTCLKTFPSMKNGLGMSACFVFFGVMALLAMLFIYNFLPETRRRTLLEIEEQFRSGKRRKTPADVEMQEKFVKKEEK